MAKLNIAKTNASLDRLLETTAKPRHRFLLMSFRRYRFLKISGRYEEALAMMSDTPAFHFHSGDRHADLIGREAVESLYRMWTDTNQCIFYAENEEVAVADHFVSAVLTLHQQVWGKTLTWSRNLSVLPGFISARALTRAIREADLEPTDDTMYLYRNALEILWLYDDQGRLYGEDVWEPNPAAAEITRLNPADVMTTHEARELLRPIIEPLPSFDEAVLRAELAAH